MKKTLQRGFTLIELLVVIAIIGILAAVVLASLNDARDGGQDASIKQSIGNVRSQAELVYNQQGFTYNSVCADNNVSRLLQAAADNRSETSATVNLTADATNGVVTCTDTDAGYAVGAPLNNVVNTDTIWCVDSAGFAGLASTSQISADTPGASDIDCQN